MNTSAKNQKMMVWIALVLANIYGFAYVNMLHFFPPPSPAMATSDIIALYANANLEFRVGVFLMILVGAWYTPWSIVISIQMAREESGVPIMAITQALASVIGSLLFAFPPVLWGIAAFTVNRSPELTVLVHQAGWLTFVTPSSFFPFQIFPIAVLALSSHKKAVKFSPFPRWFGWLTVWTGITGWSGAIAQVFNQGPFGWSGIFPFYIPTFVFIVWMVSMAVLLLKSISRQQAAGID